MSGGFSALVSPSQSDSHMNLYIRDDNENDKFVGLNIFLVVPPRQLARRSTINDTRSSLKKVIWQSKLMLKVGIKAFNLFQHNFCSCCLPFNIDDGIELFKGIRMKLCESKDVFSFIDLKQLLIFF